MHCGRKTRSTFLRRIEQDRAGIYLRFTCWTIHQLAKSDFPVCVSEIEDRYFQGSVSRMADKTKGGGASKPPEQPAPPPNPMDSMTPKQIDGKTAILHLSKLFSHRYILI